MSSSPVPVSQRIHAERLILLGWSRAILLQLAHPLMAAAIGAHSSFRGGPRATATRLRRTIAAMLDLTFGDDATRMQAMAGIRAIHDRVNGSLQAAVGPFPRGTPYSANDPDLLLWVHVTVLESVALAFETFVAPLEPAERDAYCAEAASVAVVLGARSADVPRSWDALVHHVQTVEQSGVLVAGPDALALADCVLSPPLGGLVWPAAWLNRQFTIGTLPPGVRQQYSFPWTPASTVRLGRATRLVRLARRVAPQPVARWNTAIRQGAR
jgi:uncharacterized protein (DUF2236 family)